MPWECATHLTLVVLTVERYKRLHCCSEDKEDLASGPVLSLPSSWTHPKSDCVLRSGSRIASTHAAGYIIRKRPDFRAKPLDCDEDASVHFESDHAGAARSDTKDARIRGWEMLYQYVRAPLSSVESVRPSKARVEW